MYRKLLLRYINENHTLLLGTYTSNVHMRLI